MSLYLFFIQKIELYIFKKNLVYNHLSHIFQKVKLAHSYKIIFKNLYKQKKKFIMLDG